MTLPANMGMEIDNIFGSNANNYNDVRSYTITSNKPFFRTVSKSSSKALVNYATRIELSQTSFSLYLHNQWTNFHKLSCAGKPQMRAIRTYAGCTKATTND